jgi:hypothetical protein
MEGEGRRLLMVKMGRSTPSAVTQPFLKQSSIVPLIQLPHALGETGNKKCWEKNMDMKWKRRLRRYSLDFHNMYLGMYYEGPEFESKFFRLCLEYIILSALWGLSQWRHYQCKKEIYQVDTINKRVS